MNYQTYQPHPDLQSLVKCYWTLEVPAQPTASRQIILPDGCVDMCFILGDDIKRFTHDDHYIIQPRSMLLGQITTPLYVEPTGYVNTFAVRFYPYGFMNFIDVPLAELGNKETPLNQLFTPAEAEKLSNEIEHADTVSNRIRIIEAFLFEKLKTEKTINTIVKHTIDTMLLAQGRMKVNEILKEAPQQRRQLERNFFRQTGLSPKQLSRIIRLQATLQMLLNRETGSLTAIAYENDFYDQAHFIRDFKNFTGINPNHFLTDESMQLSSVLYRDKN